MKERAVLRQSYPQIFRRNLAFAIPLVFQTRSFPGERLGDLPYRDSDKLVGLLYGLLRLIDEAGLHVRPFRLQTVGQLLRKQRGMIVH